MIILNIDYILIGRRIRKARKIKKLSQEDLAEAVGITSVYVSRIETGNAHISLELLFKLAYQIDITPGYILSGADYSSRDEHEIYRLIKNLTPQKLHMAADIIKVINQY